MPPASMMSVKGSFDVSMPRMCAIIMLRNYADWEPVTGNREPEIYSSNIPRNLSALHRQTSHKSATGLLSNGIVCIYGGGPYSGVTVNSPSPLFLCSSIIIFHHT